MIPQKIVHEDAYELGKEQKQLGYPTLGIDFRKPGTEKILLKDSCSFFFKLYHYRFASYKCPVKKC